MAQKSFYTMAATNVRDHITTHANDIFFDFQKRVCHGRGNPGSKLASLVMEFEDDQDMSLVDRLKRVMVLMSSVRDHCTENQKKILLGDGSLEPIKKLCIFYGSETLFELLDMMKVSSQEKGDAEFCPEFMIGEWIIACLGVRSTQREVDHCLVERTKSILFRLLKRRPQEFVKTGQIYGCLYLAVAYSLWDVVKALLETPGAVSDVSINKRMIPEDPSSPIKGGLTPVELFLCVVGNNGNDVFRAILEHKLFRISDHRMIRYLPYSYMEGFLMIVSHKDFDELTCWIPPDNNCDRALFQIFFHNHHNNRELLTKAFDVLISKSFLFNNPEGISWLPSLLLFSRPLFLKLLRTSPHINVVSRNHQNNKGLDCLGVLCFIALYGNKRKCKNAFLVDSELFLAVKQDSDVQLWLDNFKEEIVAILTHPKFEFLSVYYSPLYNVILPLAKELVPDKFPSSMFTRYYDQHMVNNKILHRRNTEFMDGIIKDMLEEPDLPPLSPNIPLLCLSDHEESDDDGLSDLQSRKRKRQAD